MDTLTLQCAVNTERCVACEWWAWCLPAVHTKKIIEFVQHSYLPIAAASIRYPLNVLQFSDPPNLRRLAPMVARFSKDMGFMDDLLPNTGLDFLQGLFTVCGSLILVCVVSLRTLNSLETESASVSASDPGSVMHQVNYWITIVTVPMVIFFFYLRRYYLEVSRCVRTPQLELLGAELYSMEIMGSNYSCQCQDGRSLSSCIGIEWVYSTTIHVSVTVLAAPPPLVFSLIRELLCSTTFHAHPAISNVWRQYADLPSTATFCQRWRGSVQ